CRARAPARAGGLRLALRAGLAGAHGRRHRPGAHRCGVHPHRGRARCSLRRAGSGGNPGGLAARRAPVQLMSGPAPERLAQLRAELQQLSYEYYVLDAPTRSDDEYDRLFRELLEIESEHPDWVTPDSPSQRVGSPPAAGFPAVRHAEPMLSLANAFAD